MPIGASGLLGHGLSGFRNVFCTGQESKYFRLYGLYGPVTVTQLCSGTKVTIDNANEHGCVPMKPYSQSRRWAGFGSEMVSLIILGFPWGQKWKNTLVKSWKAHRLWKAGSALFRRCEDFRILPVEFEENFRNSSWKRIIFLKIAGYDVRHEGGATREVYAEVCS